jgi:hypothetical protein
MVLDWIVPAQDDAPMAAAALAEAAARAPGLGPARTLTRDRLLPPASPLVLRVTDGPAINGYIGLQLRVTRPGRRLGLAVGYIALVERVPAGSDGTALPRQLVRALVGPLGLDELATRSSTTHRAATRLPETARPERLSAVAWVETPDGALLAATWAGSACRAR